MKYNINPSEAMFESLVAQDKHNLLDTFNQNYDSQEKTLNMIYTSIKLAKKNNFKDNRLIWNFAGYVNIVSLDLKIIGKDISMSTNPWEKRHYCRQASILLYEAIDDLFKLLGKDFIELTKNRLDIKDIENDLIQIRTSLNDYKKEHNDNLYNIRNISGAHRDKDVELLYNTVHEIDSFLFIKNINDFDEILNRLGKFLQTLINRAIELPEIKNKK